MSAPRAHQHWIGTAFDEDALIQAARCLVARGGHRLPDWRKAAVIVPHASLIAPLRQRLLESLSPDKRAYVGLHIKTLRDFVEYLSPPIANTLNPTAHELTLVDALRAHPDLFGHANTWALSAELVRLFEQLTLNRIALPETRAAFVQWLRNAYGNGDFTHAGLEREATLVHTLWLASHTQLQAQQNLDAASAYLLRLGASSESLDGDWHIVLLPDPNWCRAEQLWVETLAQRGLADVVLSGHAPQTGALRTDLPVWDRWRGNAVEARSATGAFWDACFAAENTPPLHLRAKAFAAQVPISPLSGHLTTCEAIDFETEARVIDLQLRQWRREGKTHLCIVTDDRLLARRLRALLERSGIALNDYSGWALSTTQSAAFLERWLECVENDFEYTALLDVLHSPYCVPHGTRDEWHATAFRFERDIVRHENIHRGMERYREHLTYRLRRVGKEESAAYTAIETMLNALHTAAQPLLNLRRKRDVPLVHFIDALLASLHLLGAHQALLNDAAGARVMEEVSAWRSPSTPDVQVDWTEFRALLGRTIERYNYTPTHIAEGVALLSLAQALYHRVDGMIIGGLTRDKLPGGSAPNGLFNQRVRLELGLPSNSLIDAQRLLLFRHALHASPSTLLTWHSGPDNDARPSTWIEWLETFHHTAYQSTLRDENLARQAAAPENEVRAHSTPPTIPSMPRPSLPADLQPARYSARAHQHLIDCPYQFFARHGLRLEPAETVREAMSKADQGQLIHRCLQAFHQFVPGLPGPWREGYADDAKPAACALMNEISDALYARAIEDNFEHRGWLAAWRKMIPHYINWQWQRARDWRVLAMEKKVGREISADCTVDGRLDRIDSGNDGNAIIDFKTGTIPKENEILDGEKIQLIHYAMAVDDPTAVHRLEYVTFERDKVASQRVIEGETLSTAVRNAEQRLAATRQEIRGGAGLPAWGDAQTCAHCDLTGMCRRAQWA